MSGNNIWVQAISRHTSTARMLQRLGVETGFGAACTDPGAAKVPRPQRVRRARRTHQRLPGHNDSV